jgi:CHAT domain-containing protein
LDNVQPKLTSSFFRGIKAGLTATEALRRSKLEMIDDGDDLDGEPFLWASTLLFGDGQVKP